MGAFYYIFNINRQTVGLKEEKILSNKYNFHRFLLLWSGELVSSIGSGLTSFGLGVYVFEQTGSAANMAFVTLLAFLPSLPGFLWQ